MINYKKLNLNIVKYFLIGALFSILDLTVFYILTLKFNWIYVSIIQFIIFSYVHYLVTIKLIFQSEVRFSKKNEILLIYVINIIGLLINQTVLYISIEMIDINLFLSKIIAMIILFNWNYFSRSKWLFKKIN